MNKITLGLDKLHYAPLVSDDANSVEYSEMISLPLVQEIGITVEKSEGEVYADDKLADSFSSVSAYTVSINILALSEKDRAFLAGHTYDEATGRVIEKTTDIAPYVGIAFRSMNSDGTYKYVKLLKGKFSENGESFKTKGESVEYQSKTIEGRFLARDFDDALRITSEKAEDGATWFTAFEDAFAG